MPVLSFTIPTVSVQSVYSLELSWLGQQMEETKFLPWIWTRTSQLTVEHADHYAIEDRVIMQNSYIHKLVNHFSLKQVTPPGDSPR